MRERTREHGKAHVEHYFEMTTIMFIITPGPLVSTHIQKMEAEENIHHQQWPL
jgi:hypothetical protein